MGKVFRVRNLVSDREEAMKVVLPDLDENVALATAFCARSKSTQSPASQHRGSPYGLRIEAGW